MKKSTTGTKKSFSAMLLITEKHTEFLQIDS